MADPVNMSLDDIIKKGKKNKTANVGSAVGRNRNRRGGRRNRVPTVGPGITPPRKVSRNFSYNRTNSNSPGKNAGFNTSATRRGRGGSRYFYAAATRKGANYNWTNQVHVNTNLGGNNNPRRRRIRPKRQQRGQGVKIPSEYQFHPLDRTVTLPRNRVAPFRSIRKFNWQANLSFAQKSVSRARQMLMKRRIMQNGRTRGNKLSTGRILVGQYGLVTTQRQNLQERQAMVQQKIQRARQIREQRRQQPTEAISRRGAQPRRGRNRATARTWPSSQGIFAQNRNTARSRGRGQGSNPNDNWVPPLMTVDNQPFRPQAQQRSMRPTLDPNIQRKIQYIQQRGRRNRGELKEQQISTQYMDDDDDVSSFQPTIITSRMSLSDRFKTFIGS